MTSNPDLKKLFHSSLTFMEFPFGMGVNRQGLLQGRADSSGSVYRDVRSWRQVNAGNEP